MQTTYMARITGSFRLLSFVTSSAINQRRGTTDKGLSPKLGK